VLFRDIANFDGTDGRSPMRSSIMTKTEMQAEALDRATTGQSLTNYPAIYQGFMAKGIAEADILPRENVFTFNAWKAKGRSVKRGEHGVRVMTFITIGGEPDEITGEVKGAHRKPHTSVVFHVSQTEPTEAFEARQATRGQSRYRRGSYDRAGN